MSYKAVCDWRDLTDGHLYKAGDQFPFDSRPIPAERIADLMSDQNKARKRLVEAVQESPNSLPIQEPKGRKKAVKTPKNGK
jgi:hypothetical protein